MGLMHLSDSVVQGDISDLEVQQHVDLVSKQHDNAIVLGFCNRDKSRRNNININEHQVRTSQQAEWAQQGSRYERITHVIYFSIIGFPKIGSAHLCGHQSR